MDGWDNYAAGSSHFPSEIYPITNVIQHSFNKTLNAKWNANTYTVEYYTGNGGSSGGATKLGSSSHTYGVAKNLTTFANLGGSAPSGWTFAGWSAAGGTSATTVTYTNGQSVSNLTSTNNGTVKLYAIFKRTINVYSGTPGSATNNSVEQRYNPYINTQVTQVSLASPVNITNWTRLGYRTDTDKDAAQTAVTSTAVNVTPSYNGGANYYAVYKRTLTVVYSGNGSPSASGTTANSTKTIYLNTNSSATSDQKITLRSNAYEAPTGYNFGYWNTNSAGTGTNYNAGAGYNPGLAYDASSFSKTLYAKWTAGTVQYKVRHYKFNLENKNYELDSTQTKYGTAGETITLANLKKNIAGFTYDAGYITGDTTRPTSGAVTTTTVLANGTRVINLYYRSNILYIKYHANNGTLSETHGTPTGISGSYATDTGNTTATSYVKGIYESQVGGINPITGVFYSTLGLHNYNNPDGINFKRPGFTAVSGAEWNTKTDGSGTSFNHSSTDYLANGFAGADLSTGDKTVTLYVNWVPENYTVDFDPNDEIALKPAKASG